MAVHVASDQVYNPDAHFIGNHALDGKPQGFGGEAQSSRTPTGYITIQSARASPGPQERPLLTPLSWKAMWCECRGANLDNNSGFPRCPGLWRLGTVLVVAASTSCVIQRCRLIYMFFTSSCRRHTENENCEDNQLSLVHS